MGLYILQGTGLYSELSVVRANAWVRQTTNGYRVRIIFLGLTSVTTNAGIGHNDSIQYTHIGLVQDTCSRTVLNRASILLLFLNVNYQNFLLRSVKYVTEAQ